MDSSPAASDVTTDPTPRLAEESAKAYSYFLVYRNAGLQRSLARMRQSLGEGAEGRCMRLLEEWSARWRWVERARAFDAHNESIRRVARERVLAEQAAFWERRRVAAFTVSWDAGQLLRRRAAEMLSLEPVISEARPDGSVVRRPNGKWSFRTATEMLKVATELEFAVLEAVAAGRPVGEMTEAEREAILGVLPGMADAGLLPGGWPA